jgi:chemotaxis protein CheD
MIGRAKQAAAEPVHTTSEPQIIDVYLQPGEFYFGDANTRIRTVLGSCVAITMWHPGERVGGMCHYLLPTRDMTHDNPLDGRYADEAVGLFLMQLAGTRLPPYQFEVKMFGGGRMFARSNAAQAPDVGSRNVAQGLHMLKGLGLKVKATHLSGAGHRNIMFEVWSGDVWMRHIDSSLNSLVKGG